MKDTRCTTYSLTKNSLGCAKLNSYYGADLDSRDSSVCAAFVNTDKNHFYFSDPDQVPHKSSHTYVCLWCSKLIDQKFCGVQCEYMFDLNLSLDIAPTRPYQYKFTLFENLCLNSILIQ